VFGSSGFIGSNTIQGLIDQGHSVLGCDIKEPWKPERFSDHDFLKCDVTNYGELQSLMSDYRPHFVYNFSAVIRPVECELKSLNSCDVNIRGLYNMLECCKNRSELKRFIFPSTVHIYQSDSLSEDDPVDLKSIPHLYPATKLMGEQLIKSYNLLFGIPYTIFRYGVAYGIGGHDDGVVATFIENNLKSKTSTLRGNNKRSFLNIKDHVRANILALSNEAKNQTFNLDGGEKISMRDLVLMIEEISKNKSKIKVLPARKNDYEGVDVCNEKIKKKLGWEQSISLREGISELIKIHNEK
tara:strand:- start:4202 stop:5095 length:894 start_codon:yes stop_codon:yes gene_type:complete